MAVQLVPSRPLDPTASPYHRMPRPHFNVYKPLPPPVYYHVHPPVVAVSHSHFYSYNVRFQPAAVKSSQPCLPPPEKRKELSLGPVPSGPRIPRSRLSGRCRRVNKAVRSGKDGGGMPWKAEKKPNGGKYSGGKRWKNGRGNYQQVLPLDSKTTSVMIKNIPNKYTRNLLIQVLDNHCNLENNKINDSIDEKKIVSAYDFLYLPIDFQNRVNAGFAFVNFTTPQAASRFKDAFHGKRWEFFESPKIAEITRARIQGKRWLINNCKTMDFSYGSEEDMPVTFEPARDGSDPVRSKMTILGKFLH